MKGVAARVNRPVPDHMRSRCLVQSCRTWGLFLPRSAGEIRRIEQIRHTIESKRRFQQLRTEPPPVDTRSESTMEKGPAKRRQPSSVAAARSAQALCGHHDQRRLMPHDPESGGGAGYG